MPQFKYHYRRYNEFDVLKVNLPTVAGILYFCRHVLGLLIIGMALRGGRGGRIDTGGAFDGLLEPIYMLADIPALFVLLTMMCRHPKASRLFRLIWRASPYLLLTSAVMYFGFLADRIGVDLGQYGAAVWTSIAATVTVVVYVFAAPYARDLFRQFPAAAEETDGRSS